MKSWARFLVVIGTAVHFQHAAPAGAKETVCPGNTPIEITVLAPAGSSADLTARAFAHAMSRHLEPAAVVVNRPGAGGAIGYRYVAARKPDGCSLVWMSGSVATAHHLGLLHFAYAAFEPVARILVESPLLAVRGDSRWETLRELIAEAKSHPGEITVGNSGRGGHAHIASVALFRSANAEILDVPFPMAPVVPLLLGGHVDAVLDMPAALSSHVKVGAVRVLATLAPARDPAFPDAPTAQELGYDVSFPSWHGIAAPKGTSAGIVAVLEWATRRAVHSPEFARASRMLGIRPAFMPSFEFGNLVAKEHVLLGRLIEAVGLAKQP